MSEWIEWKGGLCPVPFTAVVRVQYRSGNLSVGSFIADEFKWSHVGCTADIIAYRVIEPEQPSEQAHMMAAPTEFSGQGMLDNSIIAERDALRAEVERLTKERDAAIATADATIDDLNRLRKGREDEKVVATTDTGVRSGSQGMANAREDDGLQQRRGSCGSEQGGKVEQSLLPSRALWHALGASVSANALDPRLGMPQPDGEPVGPMSAMSSKRSAW